MTVWGPRTLTTIMERAGTSFEVYTKDPPGNPDFWVPGTTWEQSTYLALNDFVGPRTMFWDVGAWVGPFSLWAMARDATVLALEPDPVAYGILVENSMLQQDGMLVPVLGAAGGARGWVELHSTQMGNSQSSSRTANRSKAWRAATYRLDDLWRAFGRPDAIKIDVEGAEAEVIHGAWELIVDERPPIVISLHPPYLIDDDWKTLDELARVYKREPMRGQGPYFLR